MTGSLRGFGRSLGFAVVAASVFPVALQLGGTVLGPRAAWSLCSSVLLGGWVMGLAPRASGGLVLGALACGLGLALQALAPSRGLAVLGLAALLGGFRSGWCYRAPAARSLLLEASLGLVSLALARFLFEPHTLGIASAVWGFGLGQSFFFLVRGAEPRRTDTAEASPSEDPFERARASALTLLDRATP